VSRSPLEAGQDAGDYHAGWSAVSRLLRRGFSWSGHERDVAYSNLGGWQEGRGRFADVSVAAGLDLAQDGRAAASLDWDLDGDLDLVVSSRSGPRLRVLRNDQPTDNHWLGLRLVGKGRNTDGIGARVEVTVEGGGRDLMVATRRAGVGFQAQSSGWMHMGLGAGRPARVRVRWPGGDWELFSRVRADRYQILVQGDGFARPWTAPSASAPLDVGAPTVGAPAAAGPLRVVPQAPLPLPSLSLFNGEQSVRLFGIRPGGQGNGTGRPLLLSLFSHTCAPCARELAGLQAAAEQFAGAGLDLLALGVDPAEEQAQVEAFIERTGFEGNVARASAATLDRLDALQSALLDRDARLPVPASFLIDPGGRLQVIYLGEVDPQVVLTDLALIPLPGAPRRMAALPFPGRFIAEAGPADLVWFENALRRRGLVAAADEVAVGRVDARTVGEAQMQTDFGKARLRQERLEDARQHFERAVELDPTSAEAWKGLGYCRHRAGELEGARDAYGRAARYDPNDERNRVNLGLVLHALGDREGVEQIRAWLAARGSELLPAFERRVGGD
jgi:tetratricopeptide (TPR) repeat protein